MPDVVNAGVVSYLGQVSLWKRMSYIRLLFTMECSCLVLDVSPKLLLEMHDCLRGLGRVWKDAEWWNAFADVSELALLIEYWCYFKRVCIVRLVVDGRVEESWVILWCSFSLVFIRNCSTIAHTSHNLLQESTRWAWDNLDNLLPKLSEYS